MEGDNNNETPGVRPSLFRNEKLHSGMKKIGPPVSFCVWVKERDIQAYLLTGHAIIYAVAMKIFCIKV